MSPIDLVLVLLVALGIRIGFIVIHLSDPSSLWTDYERRGLKFQVAQWLDWITLAAFALPTILLFYKIKGLNEPLTTTFVGFLGIQLLIRLKSSHFPRTNVTGALAEAKIDLAVHLLMSVTSAGVVTLLAAIYLWWSK